MENGNNLYYIFLSLMSSFSSLSTTTSDINIASEIIRKGTDPEDSFSMKDIAKDANVSEATLSRYVKSLYFKDYKDFRSKIGLSFAEAKAKRNKSANNKTLDERLLDAYDSIATDLMNTRKELNLNLLKDIVNTIVNSEKTIFIGAADNIAPFYQFQLDLVVNGYPCFFFYKVATQHEVVKQADENTTLFFVAPDVSYVQHFYDNHAELENSAVHKIVFTKSRKTLEYPECDFLYPYGNEKNEDSGSTCLKYLGLCMSSILKDGMM